MDGGEDAALIYRLTAGEVMPKPNTMRTHKEQINKEPLRIVMFKVYFRQLRLPPRQYCPRSNHYKLLMGTLIYDVSIATR